MIAYLGYILDAADCLQLANTLENCPILNASLFLVHDAFVHVFARGRIPTAKQARLAPVAWFQSSDVDFASMCGVDECR
jgi:hypothetical protein